MEVINIADRRDEETRLALLGLVSAFDEGSLGGTAISAKIGAKHKIILTGAYWRDPREALASAGRMAYKANQLLSSRSGQADTSSMPLL